MHRIPLFKGDCRDLFWLLMFALFVAVVVVIDGRYLFSVDRYGDRSPRSIPARIFAILWTLTGLVIIVILVGGVASSLTSVTVDHSIILYGAKVC